MDGVAVAVVFELEVELEVIDSERKAAADTYAAEGFAGAVVAVSAKQEVHDLKSERCR